MASPFFLNVVATTKQSLKRDAQLGKDSEVVRGIVERRIKKVIMDNASKGFTTAEVDLRNLGNIDIVSVHSVHDILFNKITPVYVPVIDRLFASEIFKDFQVGQTEAGVYIFDWTHAIVKADAPPSRVSAPVTTTRESRSSTLSQAPALENTYPFYNSIGPSVPATDAEVENLISMMFPYLMASVNPN
ncbi:hypothetical protein ATCVCanal1_251L [Acanthocystis turfacea Chlorella virus Canal-1]|nr:hypothetical protein ATCVCanal1_251L [Acanthocystis turfacea Chlorella virus Canal-1]